MVRVEVVLALMLCLSGIHVVAAEVPNAETVYIGATEFITVADTPQYSASERASIVQSRVVNVLTDLRWGEDPEVEAGMVKGTRVIRVKGHIVVTVTEEDMAFHRSTPEGLVRVWVEHLDKAFREVAPRGQ